MTDKDRLPADKRKDDALWALARRERWVVTTAEMRAAGVSRDVIAARKEAGLIVAQYRGVYLVGRSTPTLDEAERAAVKACGEGAVLSHQSAAVRWGVLQHDRGPIHVTAPRQRRSRGRLRAHHAQLDPRDVTVKDGIAITTLARTLADLAGVLHEDQLRVAVHEADHLKRLHVPAVDAATGRKRRGVAALHRALARHRPVKGVLKLDLEKRFHRFLADHGFPPAEHNVLFDIGLPDPVAVDVLFRDARVVVELDGGAHDTERNFRTDRRRDRRLEALHGLLVVRITWEDLDERPDEVARDLWAILSARVSRAS